MCTQKPDGRFQAYLSQGKRKGRLENAVWIPTTEDTAQEFHLGTENLYYGGIYRVTNPKLIRRIQRTCWDHEIRERIN